MPGDKEEIRIVRYPIGNFIYEKQILMKREGKEFEEIPGTKHIVGELPNGKTRSKDLTEKQRILSPCPV